MPAPTSALERAIALHRGGDLEAAEAAYRRVLAEAPGQPDALEFLPGDPGLLSYLGFLHYASGDRDAAAALFRQWLEVEAEHAVLRMEQMEAVDGLVVAARKPEGRLSGR